MIARAPRRLVRRCTTAPVPAASPRVLALRRRSWSRPGSCRSGSRACSGRSRRPGGRCPGRCSPCTRCRCCSSSTSWTSTNASRCRWCSGRLLWGAVAATTLVRRSRNDGWGLVVARVGRPGVRGALDGRAHRSVRRGDPQGSGRRVDLPDRARRVRRHDGRLRLRRRVRPGVRGRRGRLLLHGRVRRPSERRAAGVLRPGRGERPVLARPVHRARRHGRSGTSSRGATGSRSPRRVLVAGRACRRRRARTLPVELAAARPLPVAALERHGPGS